MGIPMGAQLTHAVRTGAVPAYFRRWKGRVPVSPVPCDDFELFLAVERVRRYGINYELRRNPELQAAALAKCKADPVWWASTFLWTYHPEAEQKTQPFVLWDWQADLFLGVLGLTEWSREPDGSLRKIWADKSRKMGVSYVVDAAELYTWLFEADTKQGLVSRTGPDVWDKTEDSLFGKIKVLYEHLPSWMRVGEWDDIFVASPKAVLSNPRNNSVILGAKTTKDVFRGGRHKRVFVDEAASIPHLELVMRSIDEVGPAVCVSTPKGMGNHFARVIHNKTSEAVVQRGSTEPGAVHLRYHYSLDPRKDAAWEAKTKAQRSAEAWAQEYGIDYHASAPGRIWPDFRRDLHVYSPDVYVADVLPVLGSARIIEGWDFGSGRSLTAVCWAAYWESTDTLILLDYREWQGVPYTEIAEEVGRTGWRTNSNRSGRLPDARVGDIAGRAKDSSQRSWLENLRDEGIDITGQGVQYGRIEWAIERIAVAIRDERLFLAPSMLREHTPGLPTGAEVIENYRRGSDDKAVEDFVGDEDKPRKDIYSHLADAIQHVALHVWPYQPGRLVTQE